MARKVFNYIMEEPVLRDLYFSVMNGKGVDVKKAWERGPYYVRTAMVWIIRRVGGPVADALRLSLMRELTSEDYNRFCTKVVECVEKTEKYMDKELVEGEVLNG